MAYIGKTPASAALTSSDISDGIISTAKIANDAATADKIANAVNSAITANTAKTGISSAQTSAITANTSKNTNATHSGEVTGSGALTIADNVVDEANLKVSNSAVNGYVLTARSGNNGQMTWEEAGGGDFVKLGSTTVSSAVASISFDGLFSSTYKKYQLIGNGLLQSANNSLCYLRVRQSNSDVTGSSYIYADTMNRFIHSGAAYQGVGGASSDNKIKLIDNQSSNNSFTTNFDIDIYDPQNSSRRKLILYRSASWYNHDGSTSNFYWKHHIGAATYRGNTTALSGVTIYPSSGNFTSGSLSLYGLKL